MTHLFFPGLRCMMAHFNIGAIYQNTDLQEKALKDAYPQGTYRQEKKSGTKARRLGDGRHENEAPGKS